MSANDTITLFHSPRTRSSGTLVILEELAAPYQVQLLNMKLKEQRGADYMAINPMGKVPAILHRGALITEQIAIALYLADLFPKARLAPALDDPLRGPYLRWMVYYAACYEPAMMDQALKREAAPSQGSPYGDFATMLKTVTDQLEQSPYLLGDRFSMADLIWGNGLRMGVMFKLVPATPSIADYVAGFSSRPSYKKVGEMDAKWSADHEAAAAAATALASEPDSSTGRRA